MLAYERSGKSGWLLSVPGCLKLPALARETGGQRRNAGLRNREPEAVRITLFTLESKRLVLVSRAEEITLGDLR